MNHGLMGDPVSKALHFTLDGLSKRQQSVSNNIANVDTPGFQTSSVPFESQLKAAMSKDAQPEALLVTHQSHIQREGLTLGTPNVVTTKREAGRIDMNNVDVEGQMFQLADTQLRYQTVARVVTERLGWLRTVINEGKG
jgi:flagellar basal-body rod protein FlgB